MRAKGIILMVLLLIFSSAVYAATFSCDFASSCATTGLIRIENISADYNNAHVELMNASATYTNFLCCVTDVNHTLSYDCTHENATVVLHANGNTNAHVQRPGVTPQYDYDICMALSPGNLTCQYVNTTCSAGYSPVLSMASSESNSGLYNLTNAHVGNYSNYTLNLCCQGGNSPPTVPILVYPTQGNDTVFERNITFNWDDSTDSDGDPITYNFSLTQVTCADDNQSGLSPSTYTGGELCVDKIYWWTAQACDDNNACSAWATSWNFTILSVLGLDFTVNNTNFGTMVRNATDNTTDNSPPPFTVENTGNVKLNVTFKADDALFDTVGLGNPEFRYQARDTLEPGAYESGQTSWANVPATLSSLYTNLHYTDAHDAAYVDILVDLPYEELAGDKSSTVNITGNYSG
ncbi:hypothetical protein GOV07_02805 [Candidatus Woesearchaeota archaeon]|nr:hypothetical protein [Candidatus Woesearchaeota archaeon]